MKNNRNLIIFLVLSVSILLTLTDLALLLVYDANHNGADNVDTRDTQQASLDETHTEIAKTKATNETTTITATQAATETSVSEQTATPTETVTPTSNPDLTATSTPKPTATQTPVNTQANTYSLKVINKSNTFTLTFKINDQQKTIDPGSSKVFQLEAGFYLYSYNSDPFGCLGTGSVTIPNDKTVSIDCP
jgi:hypothetical protein